MLVYKGYEFHVYYYDEEFGICIGHPAAEFRAIFKQIVIIIPCSIQLVTSDSLKMCENEKQ